MAATMSTETQTVTSVTPSYRRNGKLFSCEPVRPITNVTSDELHIPDRPCSVDAANYVAIMVHLSADAVHAAVNLSNVSIIQRR